MKILSLLLKLTLTILIILSNPINNSTMKLKMNSKLGSMTNMHFGLLKNKLKNHHNTKSNLYKTEINQELKNQTNTDLPDLPMYFQGWVKYFHYNKVLNDKPKSFFKNENYKKQNAKNNSTLPDDEFGSHKILDEKSFFAVAYKDRLVFYSSREDGFLKGEDTLHIENMHNIPDDSHFKGSVKDLGKFAEGNCFEINTTEPNNNFVFSPVNPFPQEGSKVSWLICSDNADVKNKFMNLVIQLRLKKQHSVSLYYNKKEPQKLGQLTISDMLTQPTPPKEGEAVKVDSAIDGYWVLLQDWSTCSQKCGGGQQFQHLMCIPPKKGGKVCDGPALRTKPCNPEPCPQVHEAAKILSPANKGEKMKKPIVKLMPISSRPIRYDKCHLKENDAVFVKKVEGTNYSNNPLKIPGRVVMNERSVSIYTDETLKTNLATFIIEKTTFALSEKPQCFILNSHNVSGEFCNIDSNPKTNFVEEWNYDFNLFKKQCHTDRPTVALDVKEERELQNELDREVNSAKLHIVQERAKKLKAKVGDTEAHKVEKTQEMAMVAIQKEIKLEDLLEKEERERENSEEKEILLAIENEKKKDECLIKSIKEKEIEDQYNMAKAKQEKEVEAVKQEAQKQIMAKRQQIKLKINQMRKRAARKKKLLNGEMKSLRNQVADQLSKLNIEGNENNCFRASKTTEDAVNKYCAKAFGDTPSQYADCVDHENFCYVCCEHEFGNMHLKQRNQCYDNCEDTNNKPKGSGRWQWTEDVK